MKSGEIRTGAGAGIADLPDFCYKRRGPNKGKPTLREEGAGFAQRKEEEYECQ